MAAPTKTRFSLDETPQQIFHDQDSDDDDLTAGSTDNEYSPNSESESSNESIYSNDVSDIVSDDSLKSLDYDS